MKWLDSVMASLKGFKYKGHVIKAMDDYIYNCGLVKFNIPEPENIGKTTNGEGVCGWIRPEDMIKYTDDEFYGELKCVLLNNSLHFNGILKWGIQVVIKCNGPDRPVISPEWVKENILNKLWYILYKKV